MRTALVVALVVLLGAIACGGYAYHYAKTEPQFCQTCHVMHEAVSKWKTSSHSGVACQKCHKQSTADSLKQLYRFVTLRPQEVSTHAEVDFERCASCHISHNSRWQQIADTAGHKVHFERLGLQCVGCHSKGLHRFVRPTDGCRECHAEQVTGAPAMESFHCTTCHNFIATEHELRSPQRSDCLQCHAQLQVQNERFDAAAPMPFPCQRCHRPHGGRKPTVGDCLDCHHVRDFGLHGAPFHGDCQSCHIPHLWRVAPRATCERCHVDRSDHYAGAPCNGCHSFLGPAGPRPPGNEVQGL